MKSMAQTETLPFIALYIMPQKHLFYIYIHHRCAVIFFIHIMHSDNRNRDSWIPDKTEGRVWAFMQETNLVTQPDECLHGTT